MSEESKPDESEDSETIRCWCGAEGTYDELFDTSCLEEGCGGTGSINCLCGGDQCVCHWHGEVECPGCEDCENGDDDMDDFYEDEDFFGD